MSCRPSGVIFFVSLPQAWSLRGVPAAVQVPPLPPVSLLWHRPFSGSVWTCWKHSYPGCSPLLNQQNAFQKNVSLACLYLSTCFSAKLCPFLFLLWHHLKHLLLPSCILPWAFPCCLLLPAPRKYCFFLKVSKQQHPVLLWQVLLVNISERPKGRMHIWPFRFQSGIVQKVQCLIYTCYTLNEKNSHALNSSSKGELKQTIQIA